MRIKEEFKKSGYFWLPSTPNKKAPRTLSISDGGHIELEVIEWSGDGVEVSFNADLKPIIEEGKPIERIVGYIEEGKSVTLDDCHYKRVPLPSLLTTGISKSLIDVRRAFIGVQDDGEIPPFNTLTFSVEGIDEWVGISDFSFEPHFEESTATISYQRPEDISINLDNGMRLLITFHWTPPEYPLIKEGKISQKTYFQLVSGKERELKEFTSVAHKITRFLCFAIDKTVSLDSMKATADNLCQDLGEGQTERGPVNIYYSSPSYSKDKPKIHQHDMLFGFGKIQSDAQKKIKKWIGVYEETYPAFDLYFSAQRVEQRYLDEKFLTLTRGLEAYHKRKYDEAWRPLKQRIKCIIERLPFKEIIGNEENRRDLICKIKKMRNDLTHSDSKLDLKTDDEFKDLAVLCFKTELIFQLLLLKATDFSLEDINSIVTNCRQLQWKLNQQL